jgi:glutamate synthase (NADPH/NADH) large chain
MSGGIAYVYKLAESRVNREALQTGEISLLPLSKEDTQELRMLLERHLSETSSAVAKAILNNFESESRNFTKVLPRDYARVMEIQARALEQGFESDGQEVWTKILEVING